MKIGHTIILLGLICGFAACGNRSAPTPKKSAAGTDSAGKVCLAPSDRNPNGASELATLMRTMEAQSETWRKEITENKAGLSAVPDVYATLKTAVATDSEMKNENFDAFVDDYLKASAALVKAPKAERKTAFNAMTGTCMSCHSQMCPGPIKRIKKFYFE